MFYCCHRINTVAELKEIPSCYGIEIDLRDNLNDEIYIAHDPFVNGELFSDFLQHYNHSFIILKVAFVHLLKFFCFIFLISYMYIFNHSKFINI